MGKFIKALEENYKENCEWLQIDSKLEYLGSVIFDFTTYDGSMDILFAEKMIPVLTAIVNRQTFDYIKVPSQYVNYIAMVNTPFLSEKLNWGTSIRGAWLDDSGKYEIDCGRIIIDTGDLSEFVNDLLTWCEVDNSAEQKKRNG